MQLVQRNVWRLMSGAILLLSIGGGLWYSYGALHEPTPPVTVRFVAADASVEITAQFTEDAALLTGLGFSELRLAAVETVSGARFEDRASGVTLWRQEREAVVYKNGAIVFTGVDRGIQVSQPVAVDPLLSEQLFGSGWVWRETIMSDGERMAPSSPGAFSLVLRDGQVVGTTDCNNFGGNYTLDRASLSMGPFRATRMYCAGSAEAAFLKTLEGTTTVLFTAEGDLVLLLAGDAGSIFFTKATSSEAYR